MLEFILGRACSGKTQEIINRVALASKSGKVVLIVPEQFTFETERAIIKHKEANADNILVLSFTRLFDEVMQSFMKGSAVCVSEFEKIILVKRALKNCEYNLQTFSKYIAYKDFVLNLTDTIRDFKFAGVSTEELENAANEIGGSCGAKLKDISLIMSAYDALLENRYIDPSDKLTKLYDELNTLPFFKDKIVFIDSFTGFTGQQYKIIEKILEQARDVVFSFSADRDNNTSIDIFYNTAFAINRIRSIARSRGIKEESVTKLSQSFYSNEAMRHLEKVMFANSKNESIAANGNIRIISCNNKRDEAAAAANLISREVRENHYRFKDFIVVARNSEDYANNILRQCRINNITCFMDRSVKLSATPLCIYITTLFELVKSFSTENILKLLKLGFNDFNVEEIAELEDYTYVWDIKGNQWQSEWIMSVKGLQTDEDNDADAQSLARINLVRERVYELILGFKTSFFGNAKNRAEAIFEHLKNMHIDRRLSSICDEFETEGDTYNVSVLKQSWDSIVSVLDSLCRALEDNNLNHNEFIEAFNIAADVCEISNTPQMLDEVTFGCADRIRPSKPKISIILGANQGVFPKYSNKNGILIQSDKEKLGKFGIVLDDAVRGAVEENYLVYSMLCCAVDKVYILFSKNSMNGEGMEPSTFVSKVRDAFSDIEITDFAISSCGEFTPATAKSAFLEIGCVDGKSFIEISHSLSDYLQYSEKLSNMQKTGDEIDFSVSSNVSRKLFGNSLQISPTKFDTFHKCSLSYFLKNGLRIKKLQKADLNVLQRGTIVHYVLEKMVDKHRKSLSELSELQISAEVDLLIHEYMSSVRGAEILMTSRFAYLLDKISASAKEIVYHIACEFSQSEFSPEFCELTIGSNGDIPSIEYTLCDGSNMYLEGKIDRVDVYKNNVRVVDYKTGKMTFTLSDTLVGLNMQMLLYLYAFVKNGSSLVEDANPAGILYMPAKFSKNTKSLKMNGLISDDEEIRTAMEKENSGMYVPKFTGKSENYVSSDTFNLIFKKIDSLMLRMGDSVIKGKFSAEATDGTTVKACAYCEFASICRSSNKEHKVAENLSNAEAIEILKRGESGAV